MTPPYPRAKPQSVAYMVYGQGRQGCGAYIQARQQARAGTYLELNYFRQWMAGYMSSYNLLRLGETESIAVERDEEFIESALEAYCGERPEEKFAAAAAAIIKQLRNRHQER